MTKNIIYTHLKGLLQVRENISSPLSGAEMAKLPVLENAFLVLSNGKVQDYGTMDNFNRNAWSEYEQKEAHGRYVLPAFCDSHTHSVFAAYREEEFVMKIQGASYADIAQKGGGILNSAKKISTIDEKSLFDSSLERINTMIDSGIGALEIKSGYGLDLENELKMLSVINTLKEKLSIPIKRTFLAAHAIPEAFKDKKRDYVDEIVNHWIPFVGNKGLADYVDVFCETGYFDVGDVRRIGDALAGSNLQLKVHVNQFTSIGGIAEALNQKAVSVDHLEVLTEEDVSKLKGKNTIATLLPGCSFFLGIPYAPARTLIDNNISVALASDFNPGSSPTYNLFFIWSLACIKLKMTPLEALNALTVNGAFAMGLGHSHGRIFKGYNGTLILTKPTPSIDYFPYAFGENHTQEMLNI